MPLALHCPSVTEQTSLFERQLVDYRTVLLLPSLHEVFGNDHFEDLGPRHRIRQIQEQSRDQREAEGLPGDGRGYEAAADEQAILQYKERLKTLAAYRLEAEGDQQRLEQISDETESISDALSGAQELGGRRRSTSVDDERARKSVLSAIKRALVEIERVHPQLAEHLRQSITTGHECSYSGARPWLAD